MAGSLVATLRAPGGVGFGTGVLSPDGALLAGAPNTARPAGIYIWDTATGKLRTTLALPGKESLHPLAFSSDDQAFLALSGSGTSTDPYRFRAFSLSSGKATDEGPVPASNIGFADNVDGTVITSLDQYGEIIYAMTLLTGITRLVYLPSAAMAGSVGVDAAGTRGITTDRRGNVYVVDFGSGKVLATFHCGYDAADYTFPELAGNGQAVYCPGVSGQRNTVWDVATGASITPHDPRWAQADTYLAFLSTDGGVIITQPFGDPEALDLWSTATGDYLRTVQLPPGATSGYVLAVTRGGREVLTGTAAAGGYQALSLYALR